MIKVIKLSDVAKDYIQRFFEILEEMKTAMESVVPPNSISQNFINRMIPHHRGAIEMSENILKYTTNPEIEDLAKAIITDQTRHIEEFEQLKPLCEQENSERDLNLYERGYKLAFDKMINGMYNSQTGNNLNVDFLTEMIPHHEGAIEMAQNLLKFEVCEPLRSKCEELIMTQKTQLDEMQSLLRKLR